MEIPRRGVSKAQFFKGNYGTKMEFSEGVGVQGKNLLLEGYGYFLEQHMACYCILCSCCDQL